MNTYAWDHNLPCMNPSCKSHGRPHPNCRCYGAAEGGEITPFCSEDRSHEPDCEYFVDGGQVINPDEVVPDSEPQQEIPQNEVQMDADIPPDEVQMDSGDSSEQIKAGAEGALQGAVGPLAVPIEQHLLGVDPKDIARRANEYPGTHGLSEAGTLGASMLTGYGEAALIGKAASAIPEIASLGKIGSAALRLFVQGASFDGSDEITKSLLGQKDGNPSDTVATALMHMGATGLVTAATGGIFNILGHGLDQVGGPAMVAKAEKFLSSIAEEGKPVTRALELAVGAYTGSTHGGGALTDIVTGAGTYGTLRKVLEPYIEKIVGRPLTKANQYVSDALIGSLLKENTMSVPTAAKWGRYLAKGAKSYLPAIESLFGAGESQLVPPVADKIKQDLKDNVEDGAPQQQLQNQLNESGGATQVNYAVGGEVSKPSMESDHFGELFPEQNILLNQAKGRVYGYLNSIRPLPNGQKLPFDQPTPDREKHEQYDKAIEIAANPLKILNHVNKGDLTLDDMKHFTALYPEIHSLLSKKVTERITKAQMNNEEPPPYKKRQAMSLFLGANLDGALTPQAIQAAQATFAQRQAPQQGQAAPKKKKASLSKSSDSYLTSDQARRERSQKV